MENKGKMSFTVTDKCTNYVTEFRVSTELTSCVTEFYIRHHTDHGGDFMLKLTIYHIK